VVEGVSPRGDKIGKARAELPQEKELPAQVLPHLAGGSRNGPIMCRNSTPIDSARQLIK